MLFVYINYPQPKISIHRNSRCGVIRMHHKAGQRYVLITVETLSDELARFAARQHRFAAAAELNDMWLEIRLGDPEFERAVLAYIQRLLGKRYRALAGVPIEIHCRDPHEGQAALGPPISV